MEGGDFIAGGELGGGVGSWRRMGLCLQSDSRHDEEDGVELFIMFASVWRVALG